MSTKHLVRCSLNVRRYHNYVHCINAGLLMSTDTCRYFLNSWTLTTTGKHVPVPLSFTCNDVFDVIYIYI